MSELTKVLLDTMVITLRAAGWSLPDDRLMELDAKFRPRLTLIAKCAIETDKAIGEGVISMHLQVYIPKAGTAFNSETMIDAYEETSAGSNAKLRQHVACTSDLGLSAKIWGASVGGGKQVQEKKMILKAKVLLDSAWGDTDIVMGEV